MCARVFAGDSVRVCVFWKESVRVCVYVSNI